MKQKLRESGEFLHPDAERYELIARSANVGLWDWNVLSNEVFYNQHFKAMLGYAEDEFPNLFSAFNDALHSEDRGLVQRAFNAHFSSLHTPYDIDYRLRTKTGEYRWFYANGEASRNQVNKPYRMTGFMVDITLRKQKEIALRERLEEGSMFLADSVADINTRLEAEKELLRAKENAEQISAELTAYLGAIGQLALVSINDHNGCILQANAKFCEISGYSEEELLGRSHSILNSGTHPPAFFAEMWTTIGRGDTWHQEICNRSRNGAFYWLDSTIVPLKDSGGRNSHYLSVQVDITVSKQKEVGLQRRLKESACLYAIRQDMEWELSTDELCQQIIKHLLVVMQFPETTVAMIELADRHFTSGNYDPGLTRGLRAQVTVDGKAVGQLQVLHHEDKAFLLLEEQNFIDTVANDLGRWLERKQAEWKLTKRYEELQELNNKLKEVHDQLLQSGRMASIGQLAAGVAHEINNPVGYVYSNLGTLERYVQDVFSMLAEYEQAENSITDDEVRARLQAARKKLDIAFLQQDLRALMDESKEGITRVKNIVQDLKDFSHVDAADEWYPADLHTGLNSTLNIVHNEIKYTVAVIKEYGDIAKVECLPSQLNQVFMNLLVNAAQAIEQRGTITVRTGQQGNEVWVEIADTGHGIVAENLQRIFDPFYTTKPIGLGTGLGLSLSYSIIQKHHGRMEVQSEAGKGTTFRVWLPLQQPRVKGM